jgi:N6-adenosine-specific RNA methylase IME4
MNVDFPTKKYDIIYCDPAWTYADKALAGKRGAECKYNVMTLQELKDLRVESIANDNSIMFMWVTFPKLIDGTCMEVMKAWGFTPKTCAFNWVKYYNNRNPFMGMGRWTRANSEICILGTKGKPQRMSAGVRQLVETIYEPELIQSVPERHSKKPNVVRDRIVELCGDIPRIELFAREFAEGWDSWGDEL